MVSRSDLGMVGDSPQLSRCKDDAQAGAQPYDELGMLLTRGHHASAAPQMEAQPSPAGIAENCESMRHPNRHAEQNM